MPSNPHQESKPMPRLRKPQNNVSSFSTPLYTLSADENLTKSGKSWTTMLPKSSRKPRISLSTLSGTKNYSRKPWNTMLPNSSRKPGTLVSTFSPTNYLNSSLKTQNLLSFLSGTKKSLPATISLILFLTLPGTLAFECTLYTHPNHHGSALTLSDTTCRNLPPHFDDHVSSVSTSSCVRLYTEPHCAGRFLQVGKHGSRNLKAAGFADCISAVGPCYPAYYRSRNGHYPNSYYVTYYAKNYPRHYPIGYYDFDSDEIDYYPNTYREFDHDFPSNYHKDVDLNEDYHGKYSPNTFHKDINVDHHDIDVDPKDIHVDVDPKDVDLHGGLHTKYTPNTFRKDINVDHHDIDVDPKDIHVDVDPKDVDLHGGLHTKYTPNTFRKDINVDHHDMDVDPKDIHVDVDPKDVDLHGGLHTKYTPNTFRKDINVDHHDIDVDPKDIHVDPKDIDVDVDVKHDVDNDEDHTVEDVNDHHDFRLVD
ncbi:hypothetical protein M8J76_002083 [Diaphorina citri]|nr:hypothetical protein M8J75_003763 [Diaphorina citri]KAI5708731.1 hypothetical protein M8J76_002083 [Diaphorina citri]